MINMKKSELIKLRELVQQEVNRRERINDLLQLKEVKEFISLANIKFAKLDSNNLKEILKEILSSYKITKTNGIYVCTSSYYISCHICYEDTDYYSVHVNIDSEYAQHKSYRDIENGDYVIADVESDHSYEERPLIKDFEQNNIILNPYNTSNNINGYDEVRLSFFETSIKEGEAKAKRKILSKYPRI